MSLPDGQNMENDLFDDSDFVILEQASSNLSMCFPSINIRDKFTSSNGEDTLSRLIKGTITGEELARVATGDFPAHSSAKVKEEFLGEDKNSEGKMDEDGDGDGDEVMVSGVKACPERVASPGPEKDFGHDVSSDSQADSGVNQSIDEGSSQEQPSSVQSAEELSTPSADGKKVVVKKSLPPRSSSPLPLSSGSGSGTGSASAGLEPSMEMERGSSSHPFPPRTRGTRVKPTPIVKKVRVSVLR